MSNAWDRGPRSDQKRFTEIFIRTISSMTLQLQYSANVIHKVYRLIRSRIRTWKSWEPANLRRLLKSWCSHSTILLSDPPDGGVSWFTRKWVDCSTLNAIFSYCRMKMEDKDVDKTAFVAHHGIFEFTGKGLGLKIEPKTFQNQMNAMLAFITWQHAVVNIEDFIIFLYT